MGRVDRPLRRLKWLCRRHRPDGPDWFRPNQPSIQPTKPSRPDQPDQRDRARPDRPSDSNTHLGPTPLPPPPTSTRSNPTTPPHTHRALKTNVKGSRARRRGECVGRCVEERRVGWPGTSPRVGDSPPGQRDPPGSLRVSPRAPWLTPPGPRARREPPPKEGEEKIKGECGDRGKEFVGRGREQWGGRVLHPG